MLGPPEGLNIEWMDGGPGVKVELSIAVYRCDGDGG